MNIGMDIDWSGTTYHVSLSGFIYNNIQYIPDIVDISPLSWNGARWGDYETSHISIKLRDNFKISYRSLLANVETRYVSGGDVTIRKDDGTIIGKYIIQKAGISGNLITLTMSDRLSEFEKKSINSAMVITDENYPDSPETSRGKTIPFFSGQFRAPSSAEKRKNSIRANRVSSNLYILGESGIVDTLTLQYVLKSDDTDVTGSSTLIPPVGSDPYYYVQYSATTEEYLDVNFNFPYKSTQAVGRSIGSRFFTRYPFKTIDADGMTVFKVDEWHLDSIASLRDSAYDTHYAIVGQINGIELVKDICKMLNVHFFLDSDRKIYFVSIDFANLTIAKEFQPGVSNAFRPNFDWEDDESNTLNRINAEIAYQYNEAKAGDTKVFNKDESISRFGILSNTTEFAKDKFWGLTDTANFPKYDARPHVIRKKIMAELSFPERKRSFTANIKEFDGIKPFDLIKFHHDQFEDAEAHLFIVQRLKFDYQRDQVGVDLIDISGYEKLNTDQIFLLQSNNQKNSQNFYDSSVSGTNFLMDSGGDVAHVISDYKYGNSCISFNGTDQFLKFGNSERFFDFDPWGTGHFPSFSVWVWVKFRILDNVESICGQYENNTTDFWRITKRSIGAGNKLSFVAFEGGVNEITMNGNTSIADTNWHLVTFIKTNTTYAFYLDGNQDSYLIDTDTGTASEGLTIGAAFNGATYTTFSNIAIAALGIYKNSAGPLNATLTPNAGITDSFTIPVGLWGDYTGIASYAKSPL